MSEELKPCPFCGGKMFFQKALWPSDGNVDSIIHDGVSQCGMVGFSIGTTDESVMAAWNTRATEATLRAENELLREAVKVADDAINEMFRYFDGGETRGSYDGNPERAQLRKAGYATRNALSRVVK